MFCRPEETHTESEETAIQPQVEILIFGKKGREMMKVLKSSINQGNLIAPGTGNAIFQAKTTPEAFIAIDVEKRALLTWREQSVST